MKQFNWVLGVIMRGLVRRFVAVAVLAVSICTVTSAHAQAGSQQTPQNAHLFLTRLADNGMMKIGAFAVREKMWNAIERCSGCSPEEGPDWIATRYVAPDQCQSDIHARPGWTETPQYSAWLPFHAAPSLADHDRWETIDWKRVVSVQAAGPSVELVTSATKYRLSFGSGDLAARAALALEVVRQACDATGGTGF